MKKVLSLSALAVLFLFTPAFAQGPYLGGGLVYNNPIGSDFRDLDAGFGLDFRFGYDFGPVALEAELMGSRHNDSEPGFGSADFGGFSIDLRIFLSRLYDPDQFYLLVGFGGYSVDQFVQGFGDTQWTGSGWNLGAGLEHYLNTNLSLDFSVMYRIIRYDQVDTQGVTFSIPDLNGDTLSFNVGVAYHF